MGIRDFTQEEINELSGYILQSIEYSELGRASIYLYNNENIKTLKVFLLSFKILSSSSHFASEDRTREKLNKILDSTQKIYLELNRLYNIYKNSTYSSSIVETKINNIINNELLKINEIIEIINILSRKQNLINLDKVTGIRRDTNEGKEIYNKFRKEVEEIL